MRMYDYVNGRHYYYEFPVEYLMVQLREGDCIWMSDAPYEQDGIRLALDMARGDCLMCGLGIGLLPTFLSVFKKPVESMDIVELNREVIDLVYPQLKRYIDFPTNVIQDDAFEYLQKTDRKYDFIYVDIWTDVIATIKEIDRALELAQKCLKPNGTFRVWLMELYLNIKDRLPKTPTKGLPTEFGREPCLICGKTYRSDYAGLCMECADSMGVSELFQG